MTESVGMVCGGNSHNVCLLSVVIYWMIVRVVSY